MRLNTVVDETPAKPERTIGQKIELYGLLLLAVVVFAFYIFWLLLFVAGATRIPHS